MQLRRTNRSILLNQEQGRGRSCINKTSNISSTSAILMIASVDEGEEDEDSKLGSANLVKNHVATGREPQVESEQIHHSPERPNGRRKVKMAIHNYTQLIFLSPVSQLWARRESLALHNWGQQYRKGISLM
ncbi:hypothetical protein ACMFMF_009848 [Clarireedia jacksonii]